MATATSGSGASKGEQTRQTILDAAIIRFGREGYRSASVADIARDASVGGTVPFTYFPNKEALFIAALDEDAASVINEGVSHLLDDAQPVQWQATLIVSLVTALDGHPLARRVLSGLEPDVTDRVIEIPAMLELRKAVAERLRADQLAGLVRSDIDPAAVGSGTVTIILALLMAVLQFGSNVVTALGPDVWAVFEAALDRKADTPT